jgi:hypothetical protein
MSSIYLDGEATNEVQHRDVGPTELFSLFSSTSKKSHARDIPSIGEQNEMGKVVEENLTWNLQVFLFFSGA